MTKVPLTVENLDDCVTIFMGAYNNAPWNCQWTIQKAKQYLSELAGNVNFCGFIVYEDNIPVGAVLGHRKTWWTNQQLLIDEFFISPNFQRKGYGKKIMQMCEDEATLNGIELLVLMTNKYLPAYKFYEHDGYVAADQYVFMFKQLL